LSIANTSGGRQSGSITYHFANWLRIFIVCREFAFEAHIKPVPTKHWRSFNTTVALNGFPYRKSNPHALMVESCVCRKPRFGKFVMRYKKEANVTTNAT
jgi:hypothetical protein